MGEEGGEEEEENWLLPAHVPFCFRRPLPLWFDDADVPAHHHRHGEPESQVTEVSQQHQSAQSTVGPHHVTLTLKPLNVSQQPAQAPKRVSYHFSIKSVLLMSFIQSCGTSQSASIADDSVPSRPKQQQAGPSKPAPSVAAKKSGSKAKSLKK
jgi:hypothetical protein